MWALVNKCLVSRKQGQRGGLCNAAASGDFATVQSLLKRGKDPNDRSVGAESMDNPALQMAGTNGHEAVVQLLIEANADLEATDACGNTALTFAAQVGAAGVCTALAKAGANLEYVQPEVSMTALAIAMYGFGGTELVSTPSGHWSHPKDQDGNVIFPVGTGDTAATVAALRAAGAQEPLHGYVGNQDDAEDEPIYIYLDNQRKAKKQVQLLSVPGDFKAAFSRCEGDALNGWSDAKAELVGTAGTIRKIYGDRTVTIQFDDGKTFDFPFEAIDCEADVNLYHYSAPADSELIVCAVFNTDITDSVVQGIAGGTLQFGGNAEFYTPMKGSSTCVCAVLKTANGNLCHITGEEKFCGDMKRKVITFEPGTIKGTLQHEMAGIIYAAYGSARITTEIEEIYRGGKRKFHASNNEFKCGDPDCGKDKMLFIMWRKPGGQVEWKMALEETENDDWATIEMPDGLVEAKVEVTGKGAHANPIHDCTSTL